MQNNGGIIVPMDGIQPDKGNETIYLVRDALTGRVLAAENVTFSGTAVLKELLAPVAELEGTVLGTISDAQETLLQALEQMWPDVPHQVCQFHALRDATQQAGNARTVATGTQTNDWSAERTTQTLSFSAQAGNLSRLA